MSDGPQYPRYPGDSAPGDPGPPQEAPQQAPGQQSPPPGYFPPPAPAHGGPISNHPMQSGPPAQGAYASWGSRLGAYLLDGLLTFVIIVIPMVGGLVLAFVDSDVDPVTDEITGVNGLGIVIAVLGFLAGFAFDIWNRVFRQGRQAQSLGKKIVGIKVVSLDHGGPIGAGGAFGRWLMQSVVPGLVPFLGSVYALIDGLFPLWDDRKQSVHDKVVSSVVVRA